MAVIIFQLMNNYYQDSDTRNVEVKAPYFTLGYFDGLLIHHVPDTDKDGIEINVEINKSIVDSYDASCKCRNIVCYTDNNDKEKEFWKEAEKHPFLFISLIRLKQDKDKLKQNKEIDLESINYSGIINKYDNAICLYSYDHSELAVIYYDYSYISCMKLGSSICKDISQLKKVYTISAVYEHKLKNIKRETVSVLFKCSVKKYEKLNVFLKELAQKLNKHKDDFLIYNVLGDDDLLVEVEDVLITDLLQCYLNKQILNHDNQKYKECFYNIESQIKNRRILGNGDMG